MHATTKMTDLCVDIYHSPRIQQSDLLLHTTVDFYLFALPSRHPILSDFSGSAVVRAGSSITGLSYVSVLSRSSSNCIQISSN